MRLARKLILHVPVSDEALLGGFVEQCIRDGVMIVAVVGDDAVRIESLIDWLVIGDGGDATRFFCTTAHQDEPLEDVLSMVQAFGPGWDDPVEEVRL